MRQKIQKQDKVKLLLIFFSSFFIQCLPLLILAEMDKALIRQLIWIFLLNSTLLIFCAKLWNHFFTKLIVVLICLMLSVNFFISVIFAFIYKSKLNISFAESALATTTGEVTSVYSMFTIYILIACLFFALHLFLVHYIKKAHYNQISWISSSAFVILITGLLVYYQYDTKYQDDKIFMPSVVAAKTPLFNLSYFLQSIYNTKQIKSIPQNKINYHLSVQDTKIENYVILLGESARAKNMSLYGYQRETTPIATALKDNMLVFQNAISPSPVTILSVPIMFSNVSVENYDIKKLSDNILHLANQAGYQTYWFSTQGESNANTNVVTAIAQYANHKEWIEGYDEALLNPLQKALQEKGKKIIILHLKGSHESACDKYPPQQAAFHSQNKYDDCYDNSIKYTDHIFGEITKLLSDTSSILVYVSDHALERDPNYSSLYYHGGTQPTKEAYQVPFFIWYSKKVPNEMKTTGYVQQTVSTTNLYQIMRYFMGIHNTKEKKQSSFAETYQDNNRLVLDANVQVYEYQNMRNNIQK